MARPVRLEFGGALYQVTARGDRREAIYEDDADRAQFLGLLEQVVGQFNWRCPAYCLMSNHYHLVIATPDGNLPKGMRQLKGVFTQWSNRPASAHGAPVPGRYKAILVDADSYLLELTRYVVLNPVRAGMVASPAAWQWSSYHATTGEADAPKPTACWHSSGRVAQRRWRLTSGSYGKASAGSRSGDISTVRCSSAMMLSSRARKSAPCCVRTT